MIHWRALSYVSALIFLINFIYGIINVENDFGFHFDVFFKLVVLMFIFFYSRDASNSIGEGK